MNKLATGGKVAKLAKGVKRQAKEVFFYLLVEMKVGEASKRGDRDCKERTHENGACTGSQ